MAHFGDIQPAIERWLETYASDALDAQPLLPILIMNDLAFKGLKGTENVPGNEQRIDELLASITAAGAGDEDLLAFIDTVQAGEVAFATAQGDAGKAGSTAELREKFFEYIDQDPQAARARAMNPAVQVMFDKAFVSVKNEFNRTYGGDTAAFVDQLPYLAFSSEQPTTLEQVTDEFAKRDAKDLTEHEEAQVKVQQQAAKTKATQLANKLAQDKLDKQELDDDRRDKIWAKLRAEGVLDPKSPTYTEDLGRAQQFVDGVMTEFLVGAEAGLTQNFDARINTRVKEYKRTEHAEGRGGVFPSASRENLVTQHDSQIARLEELQQTVGLSPEEEQQLANLIGVNDALQGIPEGLSAEDSKELADRIAEIRDDEPDISEADAIAQARNELGLEAPAVRELNLPGEGPGPGGGPGGGGVGGGVGGGSVGSGRANRGATRAEDGVDARFLSESEQLQRTATAFGLTTYEEKDIPFLKYLREERERVEAELEATNIQGQQAAKARRARVGQAQEEEARLTAKFFGGNVPGAREAITSGKWVGTRENYEAYLAGTEFRSPGLSKEDVALLKQERTIAASTPSFEEVTLAARRKGLRGEFKAKTEEEERQTKLGGQAARTVTRQVR